MSALTTNNRSFATLQNVWPRVSPGSSARHWCVSAAVLLVHATLVWLAISGGLFTPTDSAPASNVKHTILATVVVNMPTQAAPAPRPVPPPRPMPQSTGLTRPAPSTKNPLPASAALATSAVTLSAPATDSTTAVPVPATAPAAAATASFLRSSQSPSPSPALVLPSSDADELNNPLPIYPRMSRRMGEQGTVLVRVFINAEGRAEKAEIRTSSGYARLDEAALDTVKRWRYLPAKRAGVAEAMWFNVPVRFVLD